jgi:ABC-type Fe3+ transport system permease subunit
MCTFSAVVFLQGPDIDLVSVAIFQTASVSYYGTACAMSVSILVIVSLVMGTLKLLGRYGNFSFDPAGMQIKEVAA